MPNILIIISSLFLLIACTEEKDNAKDQNNNNSHALTTSSAQEIPAPVPVLEQHEVSVANSNIPVPAAALPDSDAGLVPQDTDTTSASQASGTIDSPDSGNSVAPENNPDATVETDASISVVDLDNNSGNPVTNENSNKQETVDLPTFKVNKNDIVLGNPKAKVVLIEYYSPTCFHCASYHKVILPKLKKKYTDTNKIAYVIREFIGNKQDLDAAILQRCANNPDSFLKFQGIILEQQDKWAASNRYRELLTSIGQSGEVSADAYAKCLNDDQIIKMLIANTNLATTAPNFIGTPSFFINGKLISGGYSLDNLAKKLDEALQQTK